jgi:hypothetical protein
MVLEQKQSLKRDPETESPFIAGGLESRNKNNLLLLKYRL